MWADLTAIRIILLRTKSRANEAETLGRVLRFAKDSVVH
ncbi:Uncharacterised protein [Corynebacterium ulcerans]|nr:hypothetical protein CULTSU28_03910 [Corynebacterium ulcerans]STC78729.1 Uncharacterised protein [Corynebacterium ulcerans]